VNAINLKGLELKFFGTHLLDHRKDFSIFQFKMTNLINLIDKIFEEVKQQVNT